MFLLFQRLQGLVKRKLKVYDNFNFLLDRSDKVEFINYSKCSTCKKARKFLDSNGIKYEDRQIKENNPSYGEIKDWIKKYNVSIRKLFNTSGILYRKLNLKNKLENMTNDEMIRLLSTDGMLIKRPILVSDSYLLVGFKEKDWNVFLVHNKKSN